MRKSNFSFFIFSFSLMMLFTTSLYGGVVADGNTGLAWQDDYADNGGDIKRATWQDALVYCEELSLGGSDDWRLPNIRELKSIVDRSRYDPAISSLFTNVTSSGYWSSTTLASDSSHAWVVDFDSGYDYWYSKGYEVFVRCVRGG